MVDCYLCGRNIEEALTVSVDFGLFVTDVCHVCAERGEDVPDPITDEDVAE